MNNKTLPDEKKWLLHNLALSSAEQQRFIEMAKSLCESFNESELNEDYYGGYAVELWLYKKQSAEFDKELASFDETKRAVVDGWEFAPSKINDDCYIKVDDIILRHHLQSFLWFKNWSFLDNSDDDS